MAIQREVNTIAPHFNYTKCSELRTANLLRDSFLEKLGEWLRAPALVFRNTFFSLTNSLIYTVSSSMRWNNVDP